MTQPAIVARSLTRSFRDASGTTVLAVDRIDLEIPRGAVFGFLGPNGAGKTTTIRLLLGLIEPTSGDAEVLGHDVRTGATLIRERSGALLEHDGLYERLSAWQNLEYYARIWRLSRSERDTRIRELLEHFALWDRRAASTGAFSRGMKRKLAVARALLHRPDLVFLDEPTAGLDPGAAASLRDDLARLAEREGVTIFLTTHNLAEAERLCTHIGILYKGTLRACGSPAELRGMSGETRVEIVASNLDAELIETWRRAPDVLDVQRSNGSVELRLVAGSTAAPFVRAAVESGAEIEEVRKGITTLEDVYLRVTES